MKSIFKVCLPFALVFCFYSVASAQTQSNQDNKTQSVYNARKAFEPLFLNGQVGVLHGSNGRPGPMYWQNYANYKIKARLDTAQKKIYGKVTITYINNSPYNLHFLWLQMDQNTFRKSARSSAVFPPTDRNGVINYTKGYVLKYVKINMGNGFQKANYVVTDTRMQIRLPKGLKKKGHSMKISIKYSFKIPKKGKDRMGRVQTKYGVLYTIAQWYPRMCVFDQTDGWGTLPYIGGGEFYLEYGTFDYKLTVPDNMLVVGSGVLQNPEDVLTDEEIRQLEKARHSNQTVMIRSKQEMMNGVHHPSDDGMLTWHFKIDHARDVAWAASKAYIWDAARINLPNGETALAQSVYPVESAGQDAWGRSTQYLKGAIEIYSNYLIPYPYEVATNVAGNEGGMEYPSLVFCNYKSSGGRLWGVTNHEIGHTWFPMIVGSNERKYGWMDEGFNTFINDIATKRFNNGEFYNKQPLGETVGFLFGDNLGPIFTMPDVIHSQRPMGILAYVKPALALHLLRKVVLGKDRFDYAFRTYVKRWAYKHPMPWDFFNTMEEAAGEDLEWFWNAWFMNNWKLDQAVTEVRYMNGDPEQGAIITLVNKDKMPMPVIVKVQQANGKSETIKLPVEIWEGGPVHEFLYHSTSKIKSVILDPEHVLPDVNRSNNKFVSRMPAPQGMTAQNVINNYIDAIGGRKKLKNVKDIKQVMMSHVLGIPVKLVVMKKRPNMFSQVVKLPSRGITVSTVKVSGDQVSINSRGRNQQLTKKQKKSLKRNTVIFRVLKYNNPGYQTKLLGIRLQNGNKLYIVQVTTPGGVKIKDFFDTDTGLRMIHKSMNGKHVSTVTFSDYQTINGVKIPFKQTASLFGRGLVVKVQKVKINSGLDDSLFKMN